MPVKVSNVLVSSTTSTTARSVTDVFDSSAVVRSFLESIARRGSTSPTYVPTTPSNPSNPTNPVIPTGPVAPITIRPNHIGGKTVSNPADLLALKTNGNENILSLSGGNLTIENCPSNTLSLAGVRSIIVENGNLIIKCNITYADANASIAFIVRG
jgi:hypothetical protein